MTPDIIRNGIAALRGRLHRKAPDVVRNNMAATGHREPSRRESARRMTPGEAKIMAVILLVVCGLIVYGCGPEAICIAQGGDPAANAFGMEWCELDGDGFPSDGDYRLGW